jgi:Phosphoribosyl transferase domain
MNTPARRWREPLTRWLSTRQKRAGLGVWAANRSFAARARIRAWKRSALFDLAPLAGAALDFSNVEHAEILPLDPAPLAGAAGDFSDVERTEKPLFDPALLAEFSAAVAELVRQWSAILPPGTIATVPPQGASAPGPYAAEALGSAVAEALGLPFVRMLERTEPKRWHGPHHALRQTPFICALPNPTPTMVVIVDDLVTSGRTMRLSIEAIRSAGVAAFGFAFSGD